MLMTTTQSLDGQPIRQYLGVVNGEAIIGANLFKDMFASIRNVVGGRAGSYERTLADARRLAMLSARLDGVSPLATLGRGYSITRTPSGEVISRAAQVSPGQQLVTTLAEGDLRVRVEEVHNQ